MTTNTHINAAFDDGDEDPFAREYPFQNDSLDTTDEQATPLPQWATVSQVAHHFGLARSTVKYSVARAKVKSEPWVQQKMKGKQPFFLIDTTHESYLAHAQRWAQAASGDHHSGISPDSWSPNSSSNGMSTLYRFPLSNKAMEHLGLSLCPILCHGLCLMGLQVYRNFLADNASTKPWQWQWDDLSGSNYESPEAAILAAIEHKLTSNKRTKETEEVYDLHPSNQPAQRRFRLFHSPNTSMTM